MQTARGPHLENGAAETSSGGKDEASLVHERLREFGFHVGALRGGRRVQRSQQDGVDKASGWRLGPDRRKSIGGYGFTAKVEWLRHFCGVKRSGIDVLRMHWKLRDGIARHEMHPAGRLHLFHGIVPLRTGLIHLLGGGILHDVLFVLVCGNQPDDLSRPGNYGCVQVDMTAIGQNEFIEDDSELMGGSEVGIQGVSGFACGPGRGQ